MSGPVVLLAGGTGGAKLARGLLDVVGAELIVIANTGDDIEIHGGHVSPDPDLVTFWLADRIDERGWGLRDDTFTVMEALRALGEDVWFNLGDRDLAALPRPRAAARGGRVADRDRRRRAVALGVPATRAADERRPGPHVDQGPRPLGPVPGVHDPRPRGRPDRGRRVPRRGRGGADAGGRSRRSRAPRR